jgi:formate dehydrogenase gamma subunit
VSTAGGESADRVYVVRMSFLFRVQHILLMVSLLVLALTGFALMYHENRLGQFLITLEGGVINRGIFHRTAAVVLMAQLVYHAFYMLFSKEGKRELDLFFLRKQDFHDFLQALRYNLGMEPEYPRFGKYGYKEKFQYWGATIGILLVSVTGIILWAETFSMKLLPKFVLDLTLVIHGYQGLLAFVILLFWHLYIVHLHPSVFPMNSAWLTGKVDAEWLREEHPGEYDKLKGEGVL